MNLDLVKCVKKLEITAPGTNNLDLVNCGQYLLSNLILSFLH